MESTAAVSIPTSAKTVLPLAADRPFRRATIAIGLMTICIFLGTAAAWSLLAPLESAVIAPGLVSVESNRKTVQHLEGGIVDAILVRDGDIVQRGQTLIRLRAVLSEADFKRFESQYLEAKASEARLAAERAGAQVITFSKELVARAGEPTVRDVMSGQRNVFKSRTKLFADRRAVLKQRIAQNEAEIIGFEGQITATEAQLDLIDEELSGLRTLYKRKLLPKRRWLEIKARKNQREGELSSYRAKASRSRQGILELRLQMTELQTSRLNTVTQELRKTKARAYELAQKVAASTDVLRRTAIRSPIEGVVVDLRVHTSGGVIAAGQKLLDIVPSNDALIVEAKINPADIDEVSIGLQAHVQLTAIRRRERKPLEGVVVALSADRLTDPQSGSAYYLARVKLHPQPASSLQIRLQAGMGAEVFIRTGARSPLDYLMAPIARAMGRSMREQ